MAVIILLLLDSARLFASDGLSIIMQTYRPISIDLPAFKQHELDVEKALGIPVNIVSKGTACQVYAASKEPSYDVLFVSPHYGPLIVDEGQYKPLVQSVQKLSVYIVSYKTKPVKAITDLKGKVFGLMIRDQTIDDIVNSEIDKYAGLRETITFKPMEDSSAFVSLLNKEIEALVLSSAVYDQISPAMKKQLTYVSIDTQLPVVTVIARNDADKENVQNYARLLMGMPKNKQHPITFKTLSFDGIQALRSFYSEEEWLGFKNKCEL